MTAQRRLYAVLVVLVGGVLAWLVVGPNLKLVQDSLVGPGGFTLDGYRRFLFGRPEWAGQENVELTALANSLRIALGSVFLAALIGVPLAFCFETREFPGRRVFAALALAPVLLPPLVGVIAFYFLYDETGLLTRLVSQLTGRPAPWRFAGVGGVLAVHAYSMYVYFYAFVTAGLKRLDGSRPEAAASLGASPARCFWTVTLPLLTPSLVGAALLVFMLAMASYTAPLLLGVRVLTVQLVVSRDNRDFLLMGAETVVLATACIVFMLALNRLEARGEYVGGAKGASATRRPITSGWARWLIGLGGVTAVLALLLPHAMLLLMALADDAQWTTQLLPPAYSLAAFRGILTDPGARQPFLNSLTMATWATAANIVFALLTAYLVTRFRFRGKSLIELLAALPYAIPGTVIAVGLARWFSVEQWYLGRTVLISTYVMLPLAYFVRSLPLVVRAVQASLAQIERSVEEAAASLGSAPATVLGRIVLPLATPGVIAGGVLAMITSLGEFVASILLYTQPNRPIAVEIWSQLRQSFPRAAAYGVILVGGVSALLVLGRLAGHLEGPRQAV